MKNVRNKKQPFVWIIGGLTTVVVTTPLLTTIACGEMSDAEKIAATINEFNQAERKNQSIAIYFQSALTPNPDASAQVINDVLVTKLPTILPGVNVSYNVAPVSNTDFTQPITVTVAAGQAKSATTTMTLTYRGITLEAFKAKYPSKISPDGVTINPDAFNGVTLENDFALPDTVRKIDLRAFHGTTLPAGFALPNGFSVLSTSAFASATLPSGFTLPETVNSIGWLIFSNANLPIGFTWPASLNEINPFTFNGAFLPKGFLLPNSVLTIDDSAFDSAILPDGFTIPNSVTNIDIAAFQGVALPAGFSIPASATIVRQNDPLRIASFSNATLPVGYEWQDATGHPTTDQTDPAPGCTVALRTT